MSRPESGRSGDETIPADRQASGRSAIMRAGLERGDVVGRYVVLSRLGAGGMGVVYAAYDPKLDRKVALKLLHADRDPDEGRRLLREAQAMAQLSHPNVVAVHDVGEHEGTVFLAMEYVEGTTLRRFLEKRPRPWRVVLRAFVQAGRGLAAAHAKGIVHRDFKPDNAMVDDEGAESPDGPARVRVLDFGLARGALADAGAQSAEAPLLETDARSGTPAYMAPEQFHGHKVGAAADQFAFCVALYEGLYGERPFEGGSLAALAASVTTGRVRTTTAGADVTPWLRRVLHRGFAVDPAERWPSMDALLRALELDPTRRRRVVYAAVAAVAIAGAVVGAREVQRRRALAACDAEGDAIASVWSPTIADASGAAFDASDVPYASDAWARARPRFDGFAQAWTETRVELCRAVTVDGTRTGRTVAVAEDCLAEQRGQLEAVAAQLGDASPTIVERTVEWALALPDPRQCLDDDALGRRAAPPSDPSVREALVAVRRDRHAILTLVEAGKTDDAEALSEDLTARAEALQWPAAIAMARFASARVATERGRFEAAEAALREAFRVAGRAGEDAIALESAGDLAYVVGHRLARVGEGLAWAEVAQTLVERVGLAEHDQAARQVLNATAILRTEEGNLEEAVASYERLIAIVREHLGADHPALATVIGNRAAAEYMRGRYRDALPLCEEALAILERAFGPTHPELTGALINLAAVQSRLARGDEAVATSQRALELSLALHGPDHPSVVSSQAMIAGTLSEMGRWAEAVPVAELALAGLRRRLGDRHPDVAGAMQNLAWSYAHVGRAEEAVATLVEAIDIFRETRGPAHETTALAVYTLGQVYAVDGRVDEARARYREAIAVLEALPEETARLADVLVALGQLELGAGELERALELCERALGLAEEAKDDHDIVQSRACATDARARLDRDATVTGDG